MPQIVEEFKTVDYGRLEERLISHCSGQLILAIGRGSFRSELIKIISAIMTESYNKGFLEGAKGPKKKKKG